MSLPLLRPLLLTVGATSLVFFGGVIALAVQSPEPINPLSVLALSNTTLSASNLVSQSASAKQSPLATLTSAQAAALAKQDMPTARLEATPELINYNGTVAYEVLLDSGPAYIDANLGVVLNPVATNSYGVEGFDDDDYDDDNDKDKKHGNKKHDDDDYKDNGRLIATSYQQYDNDKDDHNKDNYND